MEFKFLEHTKEGTTVHLNMDVFYMYVAGHITAIPALAV